MRAYQADALSQGLRKREEDIHDWAQVFHQLVIALAKFVESRCLFSKYIQDGIGSVITFDCGSERMRRQILLRKGLVFP